MLQHTKNSLSNILHISTSDTKGGAPLATYHLHSTLRNLGFNSTLWVSEKTTQDDSVRIASKNWANYLIRRIRWHRLPIKFFRYWISRPRGFALFSDHHARGTKHFVQKIQNFSVINLHWIAQFIDYSEFITTIQSTKPVVWTMHDSNAFTGGCHINLDCNHFQNSCGSCPQLGSHNENDLSRQIWHAKYEIYKQLYPDQICLVAPSSWMEKQIKASSLMGRLRTTIIPNGVNCELFSPKDPVYSRDALGIPKDKLAILFVANSLTVEHKGLSFLIQALDTSKPSEDKVLVLVGNGKPAITPSIAHIHINYLDSKQLALAYSATDIFVIPSLQDNLPNTVMESLACGTPVVGFNVGGIPDMVRPGVTGILVPPKDVNKLGKAIQNLLENNSLRESMSKNCRKIAVEEYSLEVQAKRYIELYREMLTNDLKA